ncbi:nicotinate phosphoribosyltransferase [Mycobacterium sp. IS-836]|uniref:nicotinate phosphoribosyltransferase n=1 Tax=Mycobacterium sp. IS-836 TaxID=1834160 RepID=UPI00096DC6D0|nr:nicotinate phosphoribosyltransferase [Mycobacterium sp. IS-836]OMC55419.1 nicotinate phosphoribosyltransferase [Mycobacterium sp. IS-836]
MNTLYEPVAPLFRTDAYKLDHLRQYQLSGNVTRVYSNYTNRKSRIPGVNHVVHFGLQAYLRKYLMEEWEPFFESDVDEVCDLYEGRIAQVLGIPAAESIGSEHVRELWKLGYLPLRFCSIPEGTPVPIGIPSFTVENTDPRFFWLTNFVETGLSAGIWQASTSATIAREYRKILEEAAKLTGAAPSAVNYQCHDFSYRGMSSHESAAASGAGHLLSFFGTDSLVSLDWIDRYYGGFYSAQSVPATEHSVMCTGIATVGELETINRLLDLYPKGTVSIVSDTFDLWRVLATYLPALKNKILTREGKLVIRPDSGDPEKILCGNPQAPYMSHEWWGVLNLLYNTFGGHKNARGFIELDSHVGAIYGDSITLDRARSITERMRQLCYASTNVVFGVGSFSYQYQTRDTFGSAMKATWAEVDGEGVNLKKDPITDDGTKTSATGRLAVGRRANAFGGGLVLVQEAGESAERRSLLQPVWQDGQFLSWQTFEDVQRVLEEGLDYRLPSAR